MGALRLTILSQNHADIVIALCFLQTRIDELRRCLFPTLFEHFDRRDRLLERNIDIPFEGTELR